MTYQKALDYIADLAPRGWRLGLDRMRVFARLAGLEDSLGAGGAPQFIHVAGTNGKGSTTAYLQSILHESGYRTGSFFSPYVYDPRERIQLGRELIPKDIFAGLTAMLIPVAEEFTESEYGGISEFEFKTAMAFLFFKRLQCEWVALEVGLGGRLDATNIVSPRCCVIVSIGLDHTNILGTTIEEIAYEKAGIIKPGVPVIVGKVPEEAFEVVAHETAEKGCELWRYGKEIKVGHDLRDRSIVVETPRGRHAGLRNGIKGAMQSHNMALAVAACDAAGATRTLSGLRHGTANARIPGRFEIRHVGGKTVILDGAHNPDAAQVLVESLGGYLKGEFTEEAYGAEGERGHGVRLISGMVAGHEPGEFYRWFKGVADTAYAVPIDFHRSLPPETVLQAIQEYIPKSSAMVSVSEAIVAALAGREEVILITGSFYLVGEAGRFLDQADLA